MGIFNREPSKADMRAFGRGKASSGKTAAAFAAGKHKDKSPFQQAKAARAKADRQRGRQ